MKREIWKSVVGYEGYYEVSSYGEVKSVKRTITRSNGSILSIKEKLLKKDFTRHGYFRVKLSRKNNAKSFLVHRLVADAFITNGNNFPFVNHKDLDKTNNSSQNLEWCTHLQNIRHAVEKNRYGKLTPHQVMQIKDLLKLHRQNILNKQQGPFPQRRLAEMFNVTQTTIKNINRGYTYRREGGDAQT